MGTGQVGINHLNVWFRKQSLHLQAELEEIPPPEASRHSLCLRSRQDDRASSSLGQNRADSTIDVFVPLGLKKGTCLPVEQIMQVLWLVLRNVRMGGEWSALD